jgi:hypothetical protein
MTWITRFWLVWRTRSDRSARGGREPVELRGRCPASGIGRAERARDQELQERGRELARRVLDGEDGLRYSTPRATNSGPTAACGRSCLSSMKIRADSD